MAILAGCDDNRPAQAGSAPAETTRPRPAAAQTLPKPALPEAEGFDFFVLALSWSPSYCASEGDRANGQQCGAGKSFGFVVHGLWPQYTHGYPSECPTDQPLSVPRALSNSMLDITPSTGLIRHEWKTHGTCSGVSQPDYFALTRAAFEAIAVPAEFAAETTTRSVSPAAVEAAFRKSNPGLPADAIAVTCDRRYLRDVRICMKRDLSGYVPCPEVDGDACTRAQAVMPPIR